MKPSRGELKKGFGYIYDTNRLKVKINSIRERGKFYYKNGKEADAHNLLQFMYKINFITARKTCDDGYIDRKYFEENRYLTSSIADFGYEWEIHPAFRWALAPDIQDVFKEIELSSDEK